MYVINKGVYLILDSGTEDMFSIKKIKQRKKNMQKHLEVGRCYKQ